MSGERETRATAPLERIHPAWPTVALVLGSIAIYFGERVFFGTGTTRWVLGGSGVLLVVAALSARALGMAEQEGVRAQVRRRLFACTAGVAVALGLFALMRFGLADQGSARVRSTLAIGWPILYVLSLFPLLAIELAVLPVAFIDRYEERRTGRAFIRGWSVALLVCVVGLGNFLAGRHEWKVDLSFGTNARPSPGTIEIARELVEPVQVTAFFPSGSEVGDAVDDYFAALRSAGEKLQIVRTDQALAGQRATDAGVSENGFVALSFGKAHEKIRLGLELKNARPLLRKFDANFAKALVKVTRAKSVAYFTAGHGERSARLGKDDTRPPLEMLKGHLEANQYEIKSLGLAEGLASGVPEDAAVVFILGPEKPFLPEESAALVRATERGIRLFITLEVERGGQPLDELLAKLGLKFYPQLLANEAAYVKVSQTEDDRTMLYSNRYSSHAAVTTMTRNAARAATVFPKTGWLEPLAASPAGAKVDLVVRALPETFVDENQNQRFDPTEKKDAFGLAAAVTLKAGEQETRAFVVADTDVFSDTYIRLQGNGVFYEDALSWLRDIKEPVLSTVTEEDVRIVHKRDEDALWFYGSTLGAPLLVAGLGFVVVRRKRNRR